MFPTVLMTICIIVTLVAACFCVYAMIYARRCYEYCYTKNVRSVSLARLTELQTEMTETTDSIVAIQASLRKLRGRMQARSMNSDKPPSSDDPEEWKRRTNARLMEK